MERFANPLSQSLREFASVVKAIMNQRNVAILVLLIKRDRLINGYIVRQENPRSDVELVRELLLEQKEQFVITLTDKLLSYALGRPTEYYDGPAVRAIVRQAAADNYRMSAIILGIVKSTPFQMRKSATAAAMTVAERRR